MFALISSRSGSRSAMLLRWALQGHYGPLVVFFCNSTYSLYLEHLIIQEPVYVLHLITCHGRVMPHLAELLLLKFLRPHYFPTLSLTWFIFGVMIHIGPKFCTVPSHPPRSCQVQGHRIFMLKFYANVFRIWLLLNQMMDLIPIWYHDRYWSKVLSAPSALMIMTLRLRSQN